MATRSTAIVYKSQTNIDKIKKSNMCDKRYGNNDMYALRRYGNDDKISSWAFPSLHPKK